jgi:hypothetical protein
MNYIRCVLQEKYETKELKDDEMDVKCGQKPTSKLRPKLNTSKVKLKLISSTSSIFHSDASGRSFVTPKWS